MTLVTNSSSSEEEDQKFEIEDLGKLGEGGFSTVRKARYIKGTSSQLVALKILKDNSSSSTLKFQKEVDEMRKTNHPNIIKLIDCCRWKDKFNKYDNCMILELADVGSLATVLNDRRYDYTFGHSISWLYQCSDAINYLHSRKPPTIHRDLKPLNLLLTDGGTVLKLCDFGTVSNLKTNMTVDRGTYFWMAPEVLQTENYNEKCDVYSYAIIAWEVFCRMEPYFHMGPVHPVQIIMGVVKVEDPFRPLKLSKCPRLFRLLFERGMDGDPAKRPSMNFIFKLMKRMDEVVNTEPIKPLVRSNVRDSGETTFSSETSDAESESSNVDVNCVTVKVPDQNLTTKTLNSDMLNGPVKGEELVTDNLRRITRDRLGSFRIPGPPVSDRNKNRGHRRSKSDIVPDKEQDKALLKDQIIKQIEEMLYDPIEPLENLNESMRIYNDHKKLVTEHKNVQREIDTLKPQVEQLRRTDERIREYNDLIRQKKILLEENKRLSSMVNMNNPK